MINSASHLTFSGLFLGLKFRECSSSPDYRLETGDILTFSFNSRAGFFKVSKNGELRVMVEEDIPPDMIFYPYARLYGFPGDEIEISNCIASHTDERNDFFSFNHETVHTNYNKM